MAFDAGSTQGTAAYAINPGALPGAVDSGLFTITYDLLINDPNIGGSDPGDQFGFSFADVAASVRSLIRLGPLRSSDLAHLDC